MFVQSLIDTYKKLVKDGLLIGVPNQLDIARGKVSGARQFQTEGFAENLPTGLCDIAELASRAPVPIPPITGTSMSVVSTNVNDTIAGTGARKIALEYIDGADGKLKHVEYDLNGTTQVNLAENIGFVSDFYVTENATFGEGAYGDITIFDTATPSTIYSIIKTNHNKSYTAYRYVPSDKDFYISSLDISGDTKGITVRLEANVTDDMHSIGSFIDRTITIIGDDPSRLEFLPPIPIPSGHYFKVTANSPSGSGGGDIAVGINGWIEPKKLKLTN